MKKYVFTIKDDVCAANGKDIEASELLEKMKLWGDVEDYEKAVASVRAEYQAVVDNLTAQLNAIKDQELTNDEIALLNAYRGCKQVVGDAFQERINALEKELKDTSEENQKRLARIAEVLAQ
jgi:DNA anti-recombination protein RmuC